MIMKNHGGHWEELQIPPRYIVVYIITELSLLDLGFMPSSVFDPVANSFSGSFKKNFHATYVQRHFSP